jgi:dTDP-4-dehydrorhamnose reductase
MKILITGADGFLGKQLMFTLYPTNERIGIDKEIDITDYYSLRQTILFCAPNIVIHCAGIANPALCEIDKELAYKVNVIGTANLVEICRECSIKLIFMSTDCVFSGIKEEYYETDAPDPINYYGWTKYCGENLVKTLTDYLILRISWLYGKNSKFIKEIRNCNSFIDLDNTQIRYPLLVNDLCYIISDLINDNSKGIYNIRGQEGITKYHLAFLIAQKFSLYNNVYFLEKEDNSYSRPNVRLHYNYFGQIHTLEEGLKLIK